MIVNDSAVGLFAVKRIYLSQMGRANFILQTETPPLREDETGAVRVGDSRVLLEMVIRAFQDGATPEGIVQRYSTVSLRDMYAVIAHYLRHRDEVEEYLARRDREGDEMARHAAAQQNDLAEIRARLNACRRTQS